MSHNACVYFMVNERNTVLYIGVTSDLARRVAEHKLGRSAFTHRYRCTKLVYLEVCDSIVDAISREKQLKNWRRAWKDDLVGRTNPEWCDLAPSIGVTAEVVAQLRSETERRLG